MFELTNNINFLLFSKPVKYLVTSLAEISNFIQVPYVNDVLGRRVPQFNNLYFREVHVINELVTFTLESYALYLELFYIYIKTQSLPCVVLRSNDSSLLTTTIYNL